MGSSWTLLNVALATTAIYLLHSFVLAPVAERAMQHSDVRRVGYWSAFATAVDASRLVWMMLTLSAVVTWGAISLAGVMGGETAAAAESAINRVRSLRALIVSLEQGGNLLLLGVASVAMLYWVWRYNVRRVAGVVEHVRNAQAEILLQQLKQGALPELEPSETMRRIGGVIGTARARIEQIKKAQVENLNDADKRRLEEERAELTREEQDAVRAYVVSDIDRRIHVSPLEALEGDVPRPPRTFSERLGRFFISRGLLHRLSWGQRGLLLLNLLLTVPTVLVAAQADVGQRLEAQQFRLAEVRVDLTAREQDTKLKASVEAAQANKQPESPTQPNEAQITQAANHIAHVFERNLGQSYAKFLRPSRTEDQSRFRGPSESPRRHEDGEGAPRRVIDFGRRPAGRSDLRGFRLLSDRETCLRRCRGDRSRRFRA